MPAACQVADSLLELIGDTPVVQLRKIPEPGGATVWAKLESLNPGGSIKDRICLSMIEAAERSGALRPGMTIIEPTSGNTGIGLAVVAAVKGYRLALTMPETMSEERQSLLAAYGAELVLTEDSKGMHAAIDTAKRTAASGRDYYMPQQFANPANPEIHRKTTAEEILAQLPRIDALVLGVGTGGTVTGVGQVLKRTFPDLHVVAVEPAASAVLEGGPPGYHKIQGIGAGFTPSILDTYVYDEIIAVSDEEAAAYTRRLARDEGILVGISSGANCAASVRVAKSIGEDKTVLTVFCDTGERYLTTDLFHAEGI